MLRRFHDFNLRQKLQQWRVEGVVVFESFMPRRGDVLVWHGSLLHEGTRVKDKARTRQSYVPRYTSLSAYPEDHVRPEARRTGAYLMLNGGNVFDHPWVTDRRSAAAKLETMTSGTAETAARELERRRPPCR